MSRHEREPDNNFFFYAFGLSKLTSKTIQNFLFVPLKMRSYGVKKSMLTKYLIASIEMMIQGILRLGALDWVCQ